jgi:hypothetical protein
MGGVGPVTPSGHLLHDDRTGLEVERGPGSLAHTPSRRNVRSEPVTCQAAEPRHTAMSTGASAGLMGRTKEATWATWSST